MAKRNGPIRVLVVEDSPTARNLLVTLFEQCEDIQVVGTALDGAEAVQRAMELRPDLITMDIHLPRLNGLQATRKILQLAAIPIVVVTASLNQPDMDLTFEALRVGALSVVKKPGYNDAESCAQVIRTVRLMADVPVVHRWNHTGNTAQLALPKTIHLVQEIAGQEIPPAERAAPKKTARIVGIASSTGGPGALANALKSLPADYPLPILVVQHITHGFAASLAEWLGGELKLRVRLAEQSERPQPGTVLISPDDRHMQISDRGAINLHTSPPYKGLRPSADYLFSSLARVYREQAVGVILTGMGDDGVDGLSELHRQGGVVLAQDEATSVVYGMPREAARRKIVDYIVPVYEVGPLLMRLSSKGE